MKLLWNRKWTVLSSISALMVAVPSVAPSAVIAADGPPGITKQTQFHAFDPSASGCSQPKGLKKALTYVQENDREFLEGVNHGLSMAAQDRGLGYKRTLVGNDVQKAVEQIRAARNSKVGALIATSSNPDAVSRDLQQSIWQGTFVGTIVPPPATLLLNAPQYATGKALADAAAAHIKAHLGGKAKVVLLTQDTMQYLTPRFEAMRDAFAEMPDVTIVADIAPNPVTQESGFSVMKTIMSANPNVDVVLGGDAVVLGALKAVREAHKDRADQFFGGIDGEPEGVAELKKPGSPYKASISLSSPVFGYAMGQYAADWFEGKSIPQAMDILPIALTRENIQQYESDLADPASVFRDPTRRSMYLRMYGNICYDTRDRYVNFAWSSEYHN